jgi:hypothetical protein
MTQDEEIRQKAFDAGKRAANVHILRSLLKDLGYNRMDVLAALVIEREEAIVALRAVCTDHGDIDWTPDLHLADIIEKHLHRPLGIK